MRKRRQTRNTNCRRLTIGLCVAILVTVLSDGGFALANGTDAGSQAADTQQQKRRISGTVADTSGEPLVGAMVAEAGTGNATITGADGRYSLEVAANAILEVSSLGFVKQTLTVGSRSTVSLQMQPDPQSLEAVVVTGFGFAQKRATLTGAISTIGAGDIERSSATTVSGSLVGKIAGVNSRQTDGRPGSGTQIRIRNMGAPLYVIDGIQSDEGQFNNINFRDIESLSILKDASAAIYGVRAANGVVVVTTKRGTRNTRNSVSVNGYYGWQSNLKWAQPADAKTYVNAYVQSETMNIARGAMTESQRRYPRAEWEKWMAGTEKGYQSFDWYDYIWNTGAQYYFDANVTGGSDKANYYVSVGHINQDAAIRGYGGFRRSNLQSNVDVSISDKLKVGAGVNGRIESRTNPGVPGGDDYWLPRYATFRNPPTSQPYANGNPDYPARTADDTQVNFAILDYEHSGRMTEDWRVVQVNGNVEYEIIKGLKASALVSYYFASKLFNNQEYTYQLYGYDKANDEYYVDYTMNTPYRERVHEEVRETTSNIQLAYDRTFGRHSVNAVVGVETIQRLTPHSRVVSTPVANNLSSIKQNQIKEFTENLGSPQARMGYVGRVNYNYAEKYLLELAARYDGSWKFPPEHRWGLFPSVSAGWRISEENFWKDSSLSEWWDYLKIRGSFGLVGNDAVNDYSAFDYMTGYTFDNGGTVIDGQYVTGTVARGLPVNTVSWMEARMLDVGFEGAFLDSRLNTAFSYFRRHQTGLTATRWDVVIPGEAGFDVPRENLNSELVQGWDGYVNWRDTKGELTYTVGVNATYSRFYDWNRYDNRRGNSWDYYRNSLQHRFGYLNWGYEAVGQFQSWEEIANYPIDNDRQGNRTILPGDIKFADLNGDKVINDKDMRPIGYRQDSTPIFNYGVNLGAAWKNIDFAVDFSGSFGSTYWQRYEQANPFQNDANSPQWLLEDSWRLSDVWDANSALIPGKYPMAVRDAHRDGNSSLWESTFWKHNVRYVKLRNLELGYTLPRSLLAKAGIGSFRVYVSGANLFAISNVQGVDPEQQDENGLGYPTQRVFNIGVNIKFQ